MAAQKKNLSAKKQDELLTKWGKPIRNKPGFLRIQCVARTKELINQSGEKWPANWRYYDLKVKVDVKGLLILDM